MLYNITEAYIPFIKEKVSHFMNRNSTLISYECQFASLQLHRTLKFHQENFYSKLVAPNLAKCVTASKRLKDGLTCSMCDKNNALKGLIEKKKYNGVEYIEAIVSGDDCNFFLSHCLEAMSRWGDITNLIKSVYTLGYCDINGNYDWFDSQLGGPRERFDFKIDTWLNTKKKLFDDCTEYYAKEGRVNSKNYAYACQQICDNTLSVTGLPKIMDADYEVIYDIHGKIQEMVEKRQSEMRIQQSEGEYLQNTPKVLLRNVKF